MAEQVPSAASAEEIESDCNTDSDTPRPETSTDSSEVQSFLSRFQATTPLRPDVQAQNSPEYGSRCAKEKAELSVYLAKAADVSQRPTPYCGGITTGSIFLIGRPQSET